MFLKGYQGLGCLPHQLLISKLKAYGLAEEVVKLLESCLGGMSQQIIWEPLQVHGRNFLWESLGDLSWDLYFNIFINHMFYFIIQCIVYNYAYDNTYATSVQILPF